MTSQIFQISPPYQRIITGGIFVTAAAVIINTMTLASQILMGTFGADFFTTAPQLGGTISMIACFILAIHAFRNFSKIHTHIEERGIRLINDKKETFILYENITEFTPPNLSSTFRYPIKLAVENNRWKLEFEKADEAVGLIVQGMRKVGYKFDEEQLRQFDKTKIFGQRRLKRQNIAFGPLCFASMILFMTAMLVGLGLETTNIKFSIELLMISWFGILGFTALPFLGWATGEVLLERSFRHGSYAGPDSTPDENYTTECYYFAIGYSLVAALVLSSLFALFTI